MGEMGEGWSGPASASAELPSVHLHSWSEPCPCFVIGDWPRIRGQDHPKPRRTPSIGCIWPLPALGPTGMHHGGFILSMLLSDCG